MKNKPLSPTNWVREYKISILPSSIDTLMELYANYVLNRHKENIDTWENLDWENLDNKLMKSYGYESIIQWRVTYQGVLMEDIKNLISCQ